MNEILIVEDDEAIRDSMTELFEMENFSCIAVENGQVALDYLASCATLPKLILLDLMMPIKNGFEFCEERERDPRLLSIPVFILSADGNVEQKQRRARADGFIRKPVDIDHLLEIVNRYALPCK